MASSPADIERLRIAFLAYRGNPHCGGQGVYTYELTRALAADGHKVTVFAGRPYPRIGPGVSLVRLPSLDLYREADPFRTPRVRELTSLADGYELATMWSGGFPEPRTFSWRAHAELRGRLGEFDVVHDNHSLGSGLLRLAAEGWPLVASVHHPVTIDRDLELAEAPSRSKAWSLRRWYAFAAMQGRVARRLGHLLTVSEAARGDIVDRHGVDPARVRVVPVGVDPARYRPLPGVARVAGRIMTTASADVALKGLSVLLEALAKLRTEHPEAHLLVIGRLRPDGASAAVVERLGLERAVEFRSGLSNQEIVAAYATASLAVVPSLYEGFSLPAVEAMACGVPLVATSGGALPEVCGESAALVPPGDPGALASALSGLLEDAGHAESLGRSGRERAASCFSWAATASGTLAVYREAISAAPPC